MLNYTDTNWNVSAVAVRAERSVTQTRLTPHHITLKGPYCGFRMFNTNHMRPSLHYCGPFSKAQRFTLIFNSCQYAMKIDLQRLPVHHNEDSVDFILLSKLALCGSAVLSTKHFRNSPLKCVQGAPQRFENQRPQSVAFMSSVVRKLNIGDKQ